MGPGRSTHVRGSIAVLLQFPGGHRRGETPVPIPNTAVKPSTADGTARVASWESRSLPGFFAQHMRKCAGLFRFL